MKIMFAAALVTFAFVQSASAGQYVYYANLDGASEAPANASPGTGVSVVTIDDLVQTMRIQITFKGLLTNTTNSHIHAPTGGADTGTAGVATQVPRFAGFPSGVTSGTYDNTFDMTAPATWNPSYVTANGGISQTITAFMNALNNSRAYLNIHTVGIPAGEIRGFLHPVPEPATVASLGFGILASVAFARRRMSRASA